MNQEVTSRFPVRAHSEVAGLIPSVGFAGGPQGSFTEMKTVKKGIARDNHDSVFYWHITS